MNRSANNLTLCEDPHDFLVMQNLYDAAVRQLTLKFNILNSEFNVLYARNPIHHIDGRVKSQSSIVAKLIKRGLPLSIESARKNINDIAGVRVVCSYIDDVYRVGEMLARQTDVEIVKKQDYIQTPNYNGYRSLHMDIKVPVYLSDRTEYVVAEIQLRTIAMDFWASLEHDIRYKVDKTKLPEGINEEMFECAGKIAEIDRQMQDMYQRRLSPLHKGKRMHRKTHSFCFFTAFCDTRSRSRGRRRRACTRARNPTRRPRRSSCSRDGTARASDRRAPTPASACRCRRS